MTSSRACGARLAECFLVDVSVLVDLLRHPVRRVVHLVQGGSIAHLHLLQHCRPNTLNPCCHPCGQLDNVRQRHLRLLSHCHDPLLGRQRIGRPDYYAVACGEEKKGPGGDHKRDREGR